MAGVDERLVKRIEACEKRGWLTLADKYREARKTLLALRDSQASASETLLIAAQAAQVLMSADEEFDHLWEVTRG